MAVSVCQVCKRHEFKKPLQSWEKDPEGLCLLHSRVIEKDQDGSFSAIIAEKKKKGDHNFTEVFFPDNIFFVKFAFNEANFYKAIFSGEANFEKTTFSEDANFDKATFSGNAYFVNATFSGKASFEKAMFSKTSFANATFSGKSSFAEAIFSKDANFNNAEFSGQASFMSAKFSERASFLSTKFLEDALFYEAKFSGKSSSFVKAKFSKEASFNFATFSEGTSFFFTTFSGKANFVKATFPGNANFENAWFLGEANFGMATFSRTNFVKAMFLGEANFVKAIFSEMISFIRMEIGAAAKLSFHENSLVKAQFHETEVRRFDFDRVTWNTSLGRNAVYDEIIIRGNNEPGLDLSFTAVERLYRELKCNYEEKKDFQRVGDFYYGEMEMHRLGMGRRRFVSLEQLYWLLSGYGERPGQAGLMLLGFYAMLLLLVQAVGLNIKVSPPIPAGWGEALLYVFEKGFLMRPEWAEPASFWGRVVGTLSIVLPAQAALFFLAVRNKLGRRR